MPKVEDMKKLIKEIEDTEYLIKNFTTFIDNGATYLGTISLNSCPELYSQITGLVREERIRAQELLAALTSKDFIFHD